MSLFITKRQLTLGGLSIIVVLSALLVQTVQAAVLAGTSRTVSRDLVVNGTAEASVRITPSTNVLAGNYVGTSRITVATYEASVTGGTLALRFNPNVGNEYANPSPSHRYLLNTSDSSKRMTVALDDLITGTTTIDGWRVLPEGTQQASGRIRTLHNGTIAPGVYPVALDAVAWIY
ncbi:hypothetical protein PROVRETT_05950 [Providencia rettgeri DSM 1131]|uniref:hypothetical protein n=1 Tax=Providencia rettgeri TaxID=587 RepID=UPI000197CC74|nr:hypothetical protein [Providencia rettgeri]EFE55241.1 hypothetical protein PROVRETT_05950 [Providencia rettgeri DSM 1131]QXA59587.1 hypothetical protein I6L79_08800 [Providencia rettgeri]